MKTLSTLLIVLLFTTILNGQSISSLTPNSGAQGHVGLAVQIAGYNTNFNQGSGTYVYFSQGSYTYFSGYNSVVNSATSITTYIDLPFSLYAGVYGVSVDNGTTSLFLDSAFTVLAGQLPVITYVDTNYSSPGTTLDVTISGSNTNFSSGSSTVWFTQGSSTIYSNFVNTSNDSTLIANFTIPSSAAAGFYDVNVFDVFDNTISLPYGFFVSDSTIGIISVSGDSASYNLGNDSITLIITGNGTHYAQQGDTTIVWLGQVHRSAVANIFPVRVRVLSNTVISATFNFPTNIPAGRYDIFTFNHTDGELTKQWAVDLVATGIAANAPDELYVYPNPVNGKLFIKSNSQMIISAVSLTSLNGQVVVKNTGLNTKQEVLHTEQIASGIYILGITDQSGTTRYQKVVVE